MFIVKMPVMLFTSASHSISLIAVRVKEMLKHCQMQKTWCVMSDNIARPKGRTWWGRKVN